MIKIGAASRLTRGIPILGFVEDLILCVPGARFRCPGS